MPHIGSSARCETLHQDHCGLPPLLCPTGEEVIKHVLKCKFSGSSDAPGQRYQQDHGELPKGMRSLYNYLHGKQIERTAQIRCMQDIYRGA